MTNGLELYAIASKVNVREDRTKAIASLLLQAAEDGEFNSTFMRMEYLLSDFAEAAKMEGVTVEHDLLHIVVRWDNYDSQ